MTTCTLDEDLEELSSAEDFLQYFGIQYDPHVVHVNRLHILQRFHDYLAQDGDVMPADCEAKRRIFAQRLRQAYADFVRSDARTEKVFKVFRTHGSREVFVPLETIRRRG